MDNKLYLFYINFKYKIDKEKKIKSNDIMLNKEYTFSLTSKETHYSYNNILNKNIYNNSYNNSFVYSTSDYYYMTNGNIMLPFNNIYIDYDIISQYFVNEVKPNLKITNNELDELLKIDSTINMFSIVGVFPEVKDDFLSIEPYNSLASTCYDNIISFLFSTFINSLKKPKENIEIDNLKNFKNNIKKFTF